MNRLRQADAILGVVVAVFGIVVWLLANEIPLGGGTTLSARFLPHLLASVFVVLGVMLVLKPGPLATVSVAHALGEPRRVLVAVAIAIYFLSFRVVDFRVGTFVFTAVAMLLMGARRPLEIGIVALAVSLGMYVLFRYGFTVLLPTWS